MNFVNKRFAVHPIWLAIIVAFYLVLMFNHSFWRRAFDVFYQNYQILIAIFIILVCLFTILTVIFSLKYLFKIWLIFLIFAGAGASWFTDRFGAIIDRDMLVNAFETTRTESSHLLTFSFILYLLLSAFVPSLLILAIKVNYPPLLGIIWRNLITIFSCLALSLGVFFSLAGALQSTLRANMVMLNIITPISPLIGVIKYVSRDYLATPPPFQIIGEDAQIISRTSDINAPRVIIMVIGEAARAQNFSLQGYSRQTNPQLQAHQVFYFGNVSSCGTSTAQSVPCMFSPLTKSQFSRQRANAMSSLPDILAYVGIDIEWWENNSDSKGVASRIKQQIFYGRDTPQFCSNGECLDGIMLAQLDNWLDQVQNDSVLFIHQMGSHGPAYFKRYEEKFRQFTPDCQTAEFNRCSVDQIINAYDNSLLYTDDFLSQIINKLKARQDKIEAGLIYMSDHGQSLGENGLYLHGMPYALAPTQQTHIPFVLWLAPNLTTSLNLDLSCLTKDSKIRPLSHDNLFPTLLSLMDIETNLKAVELDMIAPCRRPPTLENR